MSEPATLVDKEPGTVLLPSITRLNSSLLPIFRTPNPKEKEGIIKFTYENKKRLAIIQILILLIKLLKI
jgi:hypothetical protein